MSARVPKPRRRRKVAWGTSRFRGFVRRARKAGWTMEALAARVFMLDSDRTLYRWIAGDTAVPAHVLRWLRSPVKMYRDRIRFVGLFTVIR